MYEHVLPDTDVLIDFLKGYDRARRFIRTHADRIVLSSIVVAELYTGVRDDAELKTLDDFISLFRVIPVTAELARAGGLYRRRYRASHGVGLADAVIAATADAEGAALKTLNVKHYPMFKGLKPAYSKPR